MEKIDLEEIGARLKQERLVEALPEHIAMLLQSLAQAETRKRVRHAP